MRGNLEDRIRRRVQNRAPACQVLGPQSAMISVPDAGRLPKGARPVMRVNSSTTSFGNPSG